MDRWVRMARADGARWTPVEAVADPAGQPEGEEEQEGDESSGQGMGAPGRARQGKAGR